LRGFIDQVYRKGNLWVVSEVGAGAGARARGGIAWHGLGGAEVGTAKIHFWGHFSSQEG
jgi:hypothetical protein